MPAQCPKKVPTPKHEESVMSDKASESIKT